MLIKRKEYVKLSIKSGLGLSQSKSLSNSQMPIQNQFNLVD